MSARIATFFPFTPALGLSPVVVGDVVSVRGHAIVSLDFEEQVVIQEFFPTRGDVEIFDRESRVTRQTLVAAKLHDSLEAAEIWVRTHTQAMPGKCNLQLQRGNASLFLIGCGVPVRRHLAQMMTGVTTFFEYEIVGGRWTTQPPILS